MLFSVSGVYIGGGLATLLTKREPLVSWHVTLAVTSNGEWVISASSWGTLRVWSLKTKKKLFTLTGHTEQVRTIAIIPDSPWLISGSSDNTLKVWNLKTKRELFTLKGHSSTVNAVAAD